MRSLPFAIKSVQRLKQASALYEHNLRIALAFLLRSTYVRAKGRPLAVYHIGNWTPPNVFSSLLHTGFSQLITGGTRFWNCKISHKYANFFFLIKYHIKCFQLDFEHVNIKRSFFGNISTQLRQSKAAKTSERRQTGESYHCTLPDHLPPPHPLEEFDLTRWDGKHCETPARGTAKQSTIWFNA